MDKAATAEVPGKYYWATELPLLRPSMLLRRQPLHIDAYPFNQPNVQYVHFARNAIYALTQQLGLSGQEILFPAYFHGVEAEALTAAGARLRFYAVHRGMQVDPDEIVSAITTATRAVYVIHYLGFPAPVDVLERICRERGLLLIEDCALALLSYAGDRPLGSFGDAAVFCLYKTLPTPDGGAVVLREGRLRLDGTVPRGSADAAHAAALLLSSIAARAGRPAQHVLGAVRAAGKALLHRTRTHWPAVGTEHFNPADAHLLMGRLSRAVIGAQDFDAIVAARRRNYTQMESLVRDLAPPVFPVLPAGVCPLFYPFLTPRKFDLWAQLRSRGIQTVDFWRPGPLAPPPGMFPEVDELRHGVLELPCHQDMTPDATERVAATVRKALSGLGP